MPIKRRAAKARRQLSDGERDDLFYGPGTCLFNGDGYLGPYGDGKLKDKPAEVQAAVLAKIEADWERHGQSVLEAWHCRTTHDLYIARTYHNDPLQPWAAERFGRGNAR